MYPYKFEKANSDEEDRIPICYISLCNRTQITN